MAASALSRRLTNENSISLPEAGPDHVATNDHAVDGIAEKDHLGNQEANVLNGSPTGHAEPSVSQMLVVDPIPPSEDPALPLNSRDVCAFIVNKMIGSGIFTTPPTVLLLTRSKGEALGLWVLGFVYTLTSMVLYLEYARRLPHTGGELIFIDEALPFPTLLTYTIYAFSFVFLYNSATNAMQFANQVLISAAGPVSGFSPDQRLLRFIAVSALTFFCLLHYFSGRAGRALNQILALFKMIMLVVVIIAGLVCACGHFEPDWSLEASTVPSSSATAFLQILFSFSGWENATFVTGEIANHQILKRGFISAVFIVGILYILVNLVFLLAVPYDDLIGPNAVTAYVPLFFGGSFNAKFAWAILIAISAAGNLVAVIYTFARVKQVIGMSNILPWSKIWKASSAIKPAPEGSPLARTKVSTPQGGLILHWIFSVILIFATSKIETLSEAIGFPGNLKAYAFSFIGIFISFGFPFLFLDRDVWLFKRRSIPAPTQRRWNETASGNPTSQSRLLNSNWGILFFALAYFAFNTYVIINTLPPPYQNANGQPLEVKGWYYAVTLGSVILFALMYYLVTIGLVDDKHPDRSILRFAGVRPKIHVESEHHPQYGCRKEVQVTIHPDSINPSYLYWFFGGSNENHWPSPIIENLWNRLLGR